MSAAITRCLALRPLLLHLLAAQECRVRRAAAANIVAIAAALTGRLLLLSLLLLLLLLGTLRLEDGRVHGTAVGGMLECADVAVRVAGAH